MITHSNSIPLLQEGGELSYLIVRFIFILFNTDNKRINTDNKRTKVISNSL